MGAITFGISSDVAENYSDSLIKEQEKLHYYTTNENKKIQETETRLEDMTIKEIFLNISKTFNNIVNEILNMEKDGVSVTFYNIISIFFKGDRMLYIGIVMFLTLIMLFVIDITSPPGQNLL
jgi:hypothetical protein|uniref:Uncharacterized protein n=1 Tax=viral metagenome TaxID=1070528 RepID=A0A6C0J4S4_9ZZZZ